MQNYLYIPFLNPVKLYRKDRAIIPKFQTRHFDEFMFAERALPWMGGYCYRPIWQTTDIIRMQFSSTFDPIIAKLVNSDGAAVITLPALVGLPNRNLPNTYIFEISMSLAGLAAGEYTMQVDAGSGDNKVELISNTMYINDSVFPNSICCEYWHDYAKGDVLFETGIKFMRRFFGHIGPLEPGSKDELMNNQRYNPVVLSSVPHRSWPVFFNDEYGMPDDDIDFVNAMLGCNNLLIDNKGFAKTDQSKIEFIDLEGYAKRGVKVLLGESNNRTSSLIGVDIDPNKKFFVSHFVEGIVFGDTNLQGSSNTIPLHQVIPV